MDKGIKTTVVSPEKGFMPVSLKDFCKIKKILTEYNKELHEHSQKSKEYLNRRKNAKKSLGKIGRGDTKEAHIIFSDYKDNITISKERDSYIKQLKTAIKDWNRCLSDATAVLKNNKEV